MAEDKIQKRGSSLGFFTIVSVLIIMITASFMYVLPLLNNLVGSTTAIPKTLNSRTK